MYCTYFVHIIWSSGRRSGGKRSQDILNQQDSSEMGKVNICFDEQSGLNVVCHFRTGNSIKPGCFLLFRNGDEGTQIEFYYSANVTCKGENL